VEQTVTITFVPGQLITWLIIGLISGFLASVILRGGRLGILGSIVVGLVGAVVGGFLVTLLGVQVPAVLAGGIELRYFDIIVSFLGAVLVLIIVGALTRRR
jgi:uncharacterized membrane protein YeaQ/YmgE (transglycosylase-associated protein family)